MHTRRNTWHILALAASVTVLPLLGCDNATGVADRKVMEQAAAMPVASTPEGASETIAKLDALSKEADLSVARKSIAKSALAGAELDAAKLSLRDLQRTEAEIVALIWEMEQTAGQMRGLKSLIDSAKRRDPATPLPQAYQGETSVSQALAKRAQAVRQGDEPWVKGEAAGSLPTASTTKKKIDDTQAKIDQIKGQIDQLTKQRDAALADSNKAQQESDAAKGEEASKAYVRGAELRKQAAMVSIQIEGLQASLQPLTQDLTAAKAYEQQVTAAAAAFDTAAKTYTDEYARVGKNIDDMTTAAKALLDGDKDHSLKAKGVKLAELVARANASRSDAVLKLQSAEAHYGDAVKDSDAVKSSMKTDAPADSPEAMLVDLRTKVHEGATLRMRQAEALTLLAAVHSSHAAILAKQVSMQQYAGASTAPLGLSVPAEAVDGKAEDDLKAAKAAAEDAYARADELLQNVAEGATGTEATRSSAKLQRAVVHIGRSNLAANTGDAEAARQNKDKAAGFQKEVEDASAAGGPGAIKIPAYLSVLTGQVSATPAGGATTAPATPPATPVETPSMPVEQPTTNPGAPVMNEQ